MYKILSTVLALVLMTGQADAQFQKRAASSNAQGGLITPACTNYCPSVIYNPQPVYNHSGTAGVNVALKAAGGGALTDTHRIAVLEWDRMTTSDTTGIDQGLLTSVWTQSYAGTVNLTDLVCEPGGATTLKGYCRAVDVVGTRFNVSDGTNTNSLSASFPASVLRTQPSVGGVNQNNVWVYTISILDTDPNGDCSGVAVWAIYAGLAGQAPTLIKNQTTDPAALSSTATCWSPKMSYTDGFAVGGKLKNSSGMANAYFGPFMMDIDGLYLDNTGNAKVGVLNKLISSSGKAMDPGAQCRNLTPGGAQPIVCLTGDATTWGTNQGYGGVFIPEITGNGSTGHTVSSNIFGPNGPSDITKPYLDFVAPQTTRATNTTWQCSFLTSCVITTGSNKLTAGEMLIAVCGFQNTDSVDKTGVIKFPGDWTVKSQGFMTTAATNKMRVVAAQHIITSAEAAASLTGKFGVTITNANNANANQQACDLVGILNVSPTLDAFAADDYTQRSATGTMPTITANSNNVMELMMLFTNNQSTQNSYNGPRDGSNVDVDNEPVNSTWWFPTSTSSLGFFVGYGFPSAGVLPTRKWTLPTTMDHQGYVFVLRGYNQP